MGLVVRTWCAICSWLCVAVRGLGMAVSSGFAPKRRSRMGWHLFSVWLFSAWDVRVSQRPGILYKPSGKNAAHGMRGAQALPQGRIMAIPASSGSKAAPAGKTGMRPAQGWASPEKENIGALMGCQAGGDAKRPKGFSDPRTGRPKALFRGPWRLLHGAPKRCPGVKTYLPEDLPENLPEDLREGLPGDPSKEPSEGPDAPEDRREEASPAFFSMSSTRWAV